MKVVHVYFISFSFLLQSCGNATNQSRSEEIHNGASGSSTETIYESNYWKAGFIDNLNSKIKSKLNDIRVDSCDPEITNTDERCTPEFVNPGKANLLAASEGQRVLVLDDASMALAAYTRYRDRVLENIVETDDGNYISDNGHIKLPRVAKEILQDTFFNTHYSKVPAELLQPSENLFYEKLNTSLSSLFFSRSAQGHGVNIFNYVANNSPNSQFVIVYATDSKMNDILCNSDREEIKKNNIDDLFLKQANALNSYIQKYNINFMLLSRGVSLTTFKRLNDVCQNNNLNDDYKKYIIKSYYDNYLNQISKNVIIVQSNANADYNVNINDKYFYSDCTKLSNRVRVGFVNDLSTSIPYFGSKDENRIYVKGNNLNTSKCTDMYINMAVKSQRPYSYAKGVVNFTDFGIGAEPPIGTQISSSYTSPIGLAYILYLKTINPYLSNNDLLKQIRVLQGKSFIVLDPALNKQLPIYKFGYLK
jgi:hypothetical protein